MKFHILAIGASVVLTACASTTSAPTYADGTMTVTTPDVTASANMQAITSDFTTSTILSTASITFEPTSDPNVIKVTVNGTPLTLTYNGSGAYVDANNNYLAKLVTSLDGQATLTKLICRSCVSGPTIFGYPVHGLETDPAQVAALASSAPGTASYNIARAQMELYKGSAGTYIGAGFGGGTLNADFTGSTVNGTVTFNSGIFGITNGAVLNMNGTISGNGFTGTVTAPTPTEFLMNSVTSTTLAGKFYGVNAADAGGTFSGTGLSSSDGTTPVTFVGGFLATP